MTRVSRLDPSFVEFIPDHLDSGVIYVSRRYSTAAHLCCCGCGLEVVTPLNPAKWRLTERDGAVSLHPSIGNWSFPCKSHYWVSANSVRWAGAMSPAAIARVQMRDRADADILAKVQVGRLQAIKIRILDGLKKTRDWVSGWWR